MKKYYFIGIGGVGMSSLALFLKSQGHEVIGSDRVFLQNKSHQNLEELLSKGIAIVPQDGSALSSFFDAVIYSTAIESDNPDFIKARSKGLTLLSRAQMLAYIFNKQRGIAVSGTSGKSTVVGMIASILNASDIDYSFVSGGKVKGLKNASNSISWRSGKEDLLLIEADESDGSITEYKPVISLITNISRDHKGLEELIPLFQHFIDSTQKTVILNRDCAISIKLKVEPKEVRYFSSADAKNIKFSSEGSRFETHDGKYILQVPGIHNIMNALAAIAAAKELKIPSHQIQEGLQNFQGIVRRLEKTGFKKGIGVYDDYSHNPAKIEAALNTLQSFSERVIGIYQPHGYGPLKLQWKELAEMFKKTLRTKDQLFVLPIYDAGGTADRSISSLDFAQELKQQGLEISFESERKKLIQIVCRNTQEGDSIIVMGARDFTLSDLARDILKEL